MTIHCCFVIIIIIIIVSAVALSGRVWRMA
jgi:hypothetical protein